MLLLVIYNKISFKIDEIMKQDYETHFGIIFLFF